MTKELLSRYSWVSLFGLGLALASSFVGLGLAGNALENRDDAAVAGLVWGALVGVVLGGLVVGLVLSRWVDGAGLLAPWVFSPGLMIGAPLLASAALSGEAHTAVLPVAVLALMSGSAAWLAQWACSNHSRRTSR